MVEYIVSSLQGIPQEAIVFFVSMLPVLELRAGLPLALAVFEMPLVKAYVLVLVANMVPAFFILYGWDAFVKFLCRFWPALNHIMQKWYLKTQVKWDKRIETYGALALLLFVAIPLPGSGVWTGAFAAWLFHLQKSKALVAIFFGALFAAITVTFLTFASLEAIRLF